MVERAARQKVSFRTKSRARAPSQLQIATVRQCTILCFYTVLSTQEMLVKVAQLYEEGRPLPRHRSIRAQPTLIGKLRLVEEHNNVLRRNIVYAVLQAPDGSHLIPRLHDAVVRHIADDCLTISGFEHDQITRDCRGQSWFVQVCRGNDKFP